MSRPRKRRRVCGLPNFKIFGPLNRAVSEENIINMTVEEYEVIRLIDLEGLEQEECAQIMDVARSTIQRMYKEAKKKVAHSLVNGKFLKIEGGDYILCNDNINYCPNCFGRRGGQHRHGRNNY